MIKKYRHNSNRYGVEILISPYEESVIYPLKNKD